MFLARLISQHQLITSTWISICLYYMRSLFCEALVIDDRTNQLQTPWTNRFEMASYGWVFWCSREWDNHHSWQHGTHWTLKEPSLASYNREEAKRCLKHSTENQRRQYVLEYNEETSLLYRVCGVIENRQETGNRFFACKGNLSGVNVNNLLEFKNQALSLHEYGSMECIIVSRIETTLAKHFPTEPNQRGSFLDAENLLLMSKHDFVSAPSDRAIFTLSEDSLQPPKLTIPPLIMLHGSCNLLPKL